MNATSKRKPAEQWRRVTTAPRVFVVNMPSPGRDSVMMIVPLNRAA